MKTNTLLVPKPVTRPRELCTDIRTHIAKALSLQRALNCTQAPPQQSILLHDVPVHQLYTPANDVHILLPKYKDLVVDFPRRHVVGLAGRFKLTKGKTIGGKEIVTGETDWFNNIITNNGKNDFAAINFNTISAYCHCGTGTNNEVATDTALQTFVASTNSVVSSNESVESTPPYYSRVVKTFRFGVGVAEGVIAEVGISTQSTNGDLWSRSRIKDGGGSPTTIEVLSDEYLDVTYEYRCYPEGVEADGDPEDLAGTIAISGVNYNYILRASSVNSLTFLPGNASIGQYRLNGVSFGFAYGSDGALGAVTSTPTGSSQDNITNSASSAVNATYSNGTYNRDITWTCGLTDGNVTGGIRCFYYITGMGAYQVRLERTTGGATLDKDSSKIWTWNINLAWTNATIP